jgi:pimeloyl-ACP methyl ester carboxylesterase
MRATKEATHVQHSRSTIVLVPGAWHGAWAWERVEQKLTAQKWPVRIVELPSTADLGVAPRSGFYDDADEVRRRIEEIDGPVLVVAHSYGGAVVSEAAAGLAQVQHIVYVCAFQLDVGESLLGLLAGRIPPFFDVDGDIIRLKGAREHFYHDVPAEDADWAIGQLKPLSWIAITEPLTTAAWRAVPSTYIVCDRDTAWPPGGQESFAARARFVRHLPSSHTPQLSMPSALADLIVEAAETAARS